MPVIRAAGSRRQVYLDQTGRIIVMSPSLDKMLYTIEPAIIEKAPTITISDSTGKTVVAIRVSALRLVLRYLPILINTANRLARRSATTALPKPATLVEPEAVNQHDKEG